ncbi:MULTISPECIES: hypothetical protein [unclassified Psychrobacter]|uniref:hypothetical protein n=1 Tax=unclassified Psychrobacter TaxID=196806 RepID=UPI0018F3EACA|nr:MULTISPECIES: hypothetical protein [unclassified Psychrobacter]
MKPRLFQYSVLAAGIVTALGITSANAAKSTAESTPTIDNIATATYSIAGIEQNPVQSNKVTVNITQSAAFSLVAKNDDGDLTDDYNKGLAVTPKGVVTFNHTLTNSGNVQDTYTLSLSQGGNIPGNPQGNGAYDLANSNVTYVIYNADGTQKSTTTVTGTEFQNRTVSLQPNEYVDISIAAKTSDNVGGDTQNLTLTAVSTFFSTADDTKATLTNINNSTTKVPVFKITSKPNSTLNLNDPTSKVTYTITIRNDERAAYTTTANNIVVFDNLPVGLRLAEQPNLSVSNNATITAGTNGAGTGFEQDSVRVTLLNLAPGQEATITFDVQKDAEEQLANPKSTVSHTVLNLDLGNGQVIYDTTDPLDSNQNTDNFYPSTDDSEVIDGTANNGVGGDLASPLVANQRAVNIESPSNKEIPTTTTAGTQVTQTAVIKNTGQETEGDQAGEIKFTITEGANDKIAQVDGSVLIVYDADNNPATPNATYSVIRNGNGDYDLSTATPVNGAPAWTGMAPNSTVTIQYQVASTGAAIGSTESTTVTLVVGGQDAPSVGDRSVQNTTTVKGLGLVKEQALNTSCSATATLTFTQSPVAAKPGDCIVYKITAFNQFANTDSRFSFDNVLVNDTTDRFNNKAVVLDSSTTPAYAIKLDNVANATAMPANNTYNATNDGSAISGTVTTLAPQKYAAMVFAVKINPDGSTTP